MENLFKKKEDNSHYGIPIENLLKKLTNKFEDGENNLEISDKIKSIKEIIDDKDSFEKLDPDSILAFSLFFWEINNHLDCINLCLY